MSPIVECTCGVNAHNEHVHHTKRALGHNDMSTGVWCDQCTQEGIKATVMPC